MLIVRIKRENKLIVNLHKVFFAMIYAEITLINGGDIAMLRRSLLDESEVKQMKINMVVDSESVYMCINENIQSQLQIPTIGKRKGQLANGSIIEFDVVGPVQARFKNRNCTTNALVLPDDKKPLLGRLAFMDMDVVIDQQKQEMVVNPDHPNCAQVRL